MEKILADIHTHTIVSGHAYGTIRENTRAAVEQGIKLLGFAEHAPGIPGTCHPFYYHNLHNIPKEIDGVRLIFGSEINVLNDGSLSLEQFWIDKLDFAIIGIHGECYQDAGKEENTKNVISCMKNPKVKAVSHPDDDHTPLDYEKLVQGAKEYGVALEVNNSSFLKTDKRLNCIENYRTMLKYCEKYRVPIVINSDAHDPSAVGKLDIAKNFIESTGFDERLILSTNPEKLLKFLEIV